MKFEFVHILGIISIFQSLVLALFFLTNRRGSVINNRIFGTILLVFAVIISASFVHTQSFFRLIKDHYIYVFTVSQAAFLIGPLIYFYVKSILDTGFSFKKTDLIHLFPFLLVVSYLVIDLNQVNYSAAITFTFNTYLNGTLLLQEFIYIALSYRLLRKHNFSIRSFFSLSDNNRYSGMRFFALGYILIWNIKLQSFLFLNLAEKWEFCPYTESMYFLVMFLFLNALVFLALKRPEIFTVIKKYESSDLTSEDKTKFRSKLLGYVETDQAYLNPDLTLSSMSKELAIHSRYLSRIINESFNKNFNDFINEYRVEESKKLLLDSGNCKKNMLEVAYLSGFNSKSSFYEAFKKNTGMTPSEFKNSAPKVVNISLN